MKIIAKYDGGSKSYGLFIPGSSDLDIRGVFLSTKISEIIGLDKNEHQIKLTDNEDSAYFELRHFLKLLSKGNSQATECLFNNIWLDKSAEFDLIQENKFKLIDSERLFKMLLGYICGEKHIINGKNTGQLGAKRKEQIEKYNYSYRNCVHALRLLRTGILFFKYNIYPIDIVKDDGMFGHLILDVKLNPQNHTKENLLLLIDKLEEELKQSFDNRYLNYKFDINLANEVCHRLYMPILKSI